MAPGWKAAVSVLVATGVILLVAWGARSDQPLKLLSVLRLPGAPGAGASDTATARPVDSVLPAAPKAPPIVLQTRWTASWTNVRLHPESGSAVLEQLPPGTRVDGFRDPSGWWFVYAYGDSLGYVAGSLLRAEPPDSLNQP